MRTRATRNRRGKARLPLLERLEDRTVPSGLPLVPSFSLVNVSFTPGQSAVAHAEHAESLPPGLEKHLGLGQTAGGESTTSTASQQTAGLTESAAPSARHAFSLLVLVIDLPPASSTSAPASQAAGSNSTTTADSGVAAQAATLSAGLPSATTSAADSLAGATPTGNATTPANGAQVATTSFSAGFVLVGEGGTGQFVLAANTNAVVPPAAVPGLSPDGTTQVTPPTPARLSGGSFGQGDWLLEAPARPTPDDKPGEAPGAVPLPAPGKEGPDDLLADPAARDGVAALPDKPADPVTPAEREVPAADVRPEGSAEEEKVAVADLGRDEAQGPEAAADFFPAELAAVKAAGEELLESAESLTAGEGRWWEYLGAVTLAATATASEVLRRRARLAEEEEAIDEETLVARLARRGA
jgi:hypothetical protein